jgi:hypothetical protein
MHIQQQTVSKYLVTYHNLGRVPGYIEENFCFCTFSCKEKKLNIDKNNPPWG